MAQLDERYSKIAVILHWSMAAIIFCLIGMGLWMTGDGGDMMLKFRVYQWHKSLGVILLILIMLRILWRLTHKAPMESQNFPKWERVLACLGHLGLYALMLVLPVTGWLMVSSSPLGLPTIVFGWFEWPHLPGVTIDEATTDFYKGLHEFFAYLIMGMIALHIAAVIKHWVIDRENILPRMWLPPRKKPAPQTGETA